MTRQNKILLWSTLLFLPTVAHASGSGSVMQFLSHPIVSTLLLVLGFVGLVLEIFTPGFGPFGVASLIGFGLFFAAAWSGQDPSALPLILFVLGLIFGAVELMVPGFGLPGIAGIVLIAAGVVFSFEDTLVGLQAMSAAIIVTMVVVVLMVRAGFKSPIFDKVKLALNFTDKSGYVSSSDKSHFVGMTGEAITNLRPAGTVEIAEEPVDVVTEGEFIEKGEPVHVIRVEGAKIIVRRSTT